MQKVPTLQSGLEIFKKSQRIKSEESEPINYSTGILSSTYCIYFLLTFLLQETKEPGGDFKDFFKIQNSILLSNVHAASNGSMLKNKTNSYELCVITTFQGRSRERCPHQVSGGQSH